jgi:hypothetical protein
MSTIMANAAGFTGSASTGSTDGKICGYKTQNDVSCVPYGRSFPHNIQQGHCVANVASVESRVVNQEANQSLRPEPEVMQPVCRPATWSKPAHT